MTQKEYLADPCGVSSLPFWKAERIKVPENMQIVHDSVYQPSLWTDYRDEPYFRLLHPLHSLESAVLPAGFSFCTAATEDFACHIRRCYEGSCMTAGELESYARHPVYCEKLWVALRDDRTGQIVATGIAELDRRIGEGILEWIQVSKPYRGFGLGRCVVLELLRRLRTMANFVTVSGQVHNPTRPEALYRSCGFVGQDVWHILTKNKAGSADS